MNCRTDRDASLRKPTGMHHFNAPEEMGMVTQIIFFSGVNEAIFFKWSAKFNLFQDEHIQNEMTFSLSR